MTIKRAHLQLTFLLLLVLALAVIAFLIWRPILMPLPDAETASPAATITRVDSALSPSPDTPVPPALTLFLTTTSTQAPIFPTADSPTAPIPQSRTPTSQPLTPVSRSPTPDSHSPTPTPTGGATDTGPTALPPSDMLDYNGSGDGSTPALDLPAGVYRIFFRSDGGFRQVVPVVESGQCGAYPLFNNAPGPFTGSATYRSIGCTLRFQVEGITGAWQIRIETAAADGLLSPPVTLSGDTATTTELVELLAGNYRLTFETGSGGMVTPVIAAGLCLERPIFLVSGAGSYEARYTSTGCQIVFQIEGVTAGWKLTITVE